MRGAGRLAIASALALVVMTVAHRAVADAPDGGVPSWLAPRQQAELPASAGLPMGRIVLVLVVTAALGAGAWYVRRRKLGSRRSLGQQLRLVESTRIGAKSELVIASVNGRAMLLGVTEANIRKLAWLDDPSVESPAAAQDVTRDSFTGVLRSLIAETTADEDSPAGLAVAPKPAPSPERARDRRKVDPQDSVRIEGQAAGLTRARRRS